MGKPNKKPTMMQVKNAINNLIQEYSKLGEYVTNLDRTLGSYIEFKKDGKKFPKWLEKQIKEVKKEVKKKEKN
tara:strand:+ start:28 stop:246 length:219 start_codon:yes stop_codon:yes gene_type:complete